MKLLPAGAEALLGLLGLPADADLLTHAVSEYLESTEGASTAEDYIKALYPKAEYKQMGDDLFTNTGETDLDGASLDSASLWKVTITPGSDPISSINFGVTDTEEDTHVDESAVLNTPVITQGTIVVGVVVNHPAADIASIVAFINDLEIIARSEE